jgi:hypothetical protein
MTENDEPLRELCYDYRNADTAHAENYFQRIFGWVRQQAVRQERRRNEILEEAEDAMLAVFGDMDRIYLFTSGFDSRIIEARDAIRALKTSKPVAGRD